jgi:hypothetical protein
MSRYDIRQVSKPEFAIQSLSKEDGEKTTELFEAPFKPYCYVEAKPDDKTYQAELIDIANANDCEVHTNEMHTTAEGRDRVWKVTGDDP